MCRILACPLFALAALLPAPPCPASDSAQAAKDATVVETLLRLKTVDVNSSPQLKEAVLRYLQSYRGTARYLDIVEQLKLRGVEDELVRLSLEKPEDTLGVRAATLLEKSGELRRLQDAINGDNEQHAVAAATVLGLVGGNAAREILGPLPTDLHRPLSVRSAAVRGLGRGRQGEQELLDLVESNKLPADLRFSAANVLYASADEQVRKRVAEHIQLPATAAAKPLPPIAELIQREGDIARGKQLFSGQAECNKCHKVAGEGKEVGPDLSEIGGKLSKESLYVSILDPSAGISHNYESYALLLADGTIHTGVLVSETDDQVTIKTAEALERKFSAADIDEMRKLPTSLMPADLQKNLSEQDLVDLVEYLTTLKKAG